MILFAATVAISITLGFALGYDLGWKKHQKAINDGMRAIRDGTPVD